jgi:hypothetical protein
VEKCLGLWKITIQDTAWQHIGNLHFRVRTRMPSSDFPFSCLPHSSQLWLLVFVALTDSFSLYFLSVLLMMVEGCSAM